MRRIQKPHKEELEKIECEHGSDNVFADLGFENPEEELLKADLIAEIASIIKKKKLTQIQAAKIIGIRQPRISTLLSGRTDLFSVEMLMHFLNALGQDIKLIIVPKPKTRKHAYSSVYQSSSRSLNTVPMAAKSHK